MCAAVVSCFQEVMTAEHILCLFGRRLPGLGLMISMALGFVPRLRKRWRRTEQVQRLYDEEKGGRLLSRLRRLLFVASVMVTWTLDASVHTVDSMRARGYGLPGRTFFHMYRFRIRDGIFILGTAGAALALGAGFSTGVLCVQYFPYVRMTAGEAAFGVGAKAVYLVYFAACLLPACLGGTEALRDRRKRREIAENAAAGIAKL